KNDSSIIEEFMMPVARANNFQRGDARLSYGQDRGTWLDFTQGPVQQTGNPLDVAIAGNAFPVVQTHRGAPYTRNGRLKLSGAGRRAAGRSTKGRADPGRARKIERARGQRDDAHDRGEPYLHGGRWHAAKPERPAQECHPAAR